MSSATDRFFFSALKGIAKRRQSQKTVNIKLSKGEQIEINEPHLAKITFCSKSILVKYNGNNIMSISKLHH